MALQLTELLKGTDNQMQPALKANEVTITGLTADSRRVAPGYLFAALNGSQADGRRFIPQAIAKGAVAVLAETGTTLSDTEQRSADSEIRLITDENPRRRLALLAARFYGEQPGYIAAVTGTNGKTSVADFCRQIWQGEGYNAASLGTLGLMPPMAGAPKALTTPDPVELQRCLADLTSNGVEHLVLEASSHGLDQYRLDGVDLKAAAFTNLSRDHLDYHGSFDAYLAAKARLFKELLWSGGTAVLNADVPAFQSLREVCDARGIKVWSYGRKGRELHLLKQELTPEGQRLTLQVFGKQLEVELGLVGVFQASNLLAALGLTLANGLDAEVIAQALPRLKGVPGRAEFVAKSPKGGSVYVDYAHTPDALGTILQAVRPHTQNKLWVVFGCGGDRDKGKRPEMGSLAARHADKVIVTDDNPRSEDPAVIRAEILGAVPEAEEFADRGEAIAYAMAELGAGDVLVIAGKGHESGQIVGEHVLPFDDRDVARAAAGLPAAPRNGERA